jgi:PmbA protein
MTQQQALLKQQQSELLAAAELALKLAKQAGAQAQVGASKSSGLSISTRLQQVENIEFNNDGALGISVYLGQRKGNASTSDLSPSAVQSAVEAALSIAKYTSEDPYNGLPDQDLLEFSPPDLDLYHPYEIEVDSVVQLALQAEKQAMEADTRIVNSEGASFNAHSGIRVYGNSYGLLNSYLSSRYSLSCCVIAEAEQQMEQDYEYTIARRFQICNRRNGLGSSVQKKP